MAGKLLASVLTCLLYGASSLAQTQTAPPSGLAGILAQASTAFSPDQPISSVELQGTATWHIGDTEDSGAIDLKAFATGASTVQMSLAKRGQRTESQSAITDDRSCSWTGAAAATHDVAQSNCWTPLPWFLPQLSLQAASMPKNLLLQDLSSAATSAGNYQVRYQISSAPGKTAATVTDTILQLSTADLSLDRTTYLPAKLDYKQHAENLPNASLTVEIRYSDYRKTSGVTVPFHIERYVNGVLELAIDVSNISVN